MTTMNIRAFESTDLERVMELYHASVHALGAACYSTEQLAAWAPAKPDVNWWRRRLAARHTFIAEQGGVIAGFASYEPDGHLDLLYVHPTFARRGVATCLYHRIETELRAAAVSRIFTEASLVAWPFFEHCGFQVDAEETVECRGVPLRRYVMHKELSK